MARMMLASETMAEYLQSLAQPQWAPEESTVSPEVFRAMFNAYVKNTADILVDERNIDMLREHEAGLSDAESVALWNRLCQNYSEDIMDELRDDRSVFSLHYTSGDMHMYQGVPRWTNLEYRGRKISLHNRFRCDNLSE